MPGYLCMRMHACPRSNHRQHFPSLQWGMRAPKFLQEACCNTRLLRSKKTFIIHMCTTICMLIVQSARKSTRPLSQYAVKAQTSLAPLSWCHGSRVTTAHVHQCCIFQSYAKTVPSRMKLTMKLTMREPAFMGSMTTDHVITACDVWLNSVYKPITFCLEPGHLCGASNLNEPPFLSAFDSVEGSSTRGYKKFTNRGGWRGIRGDWGRDS